MSITSFSVKGGSDSYLSASDIASGYVFTYSLDNTTSWGSDVLIAISDSSNNLLYWYTETGGTTATIPAGALGSYQGPIQIQVFQGTAQSGGDSSGAFNGTSASYPSSSQFTYHDNSISTPNTAVISSTTADATLSDTLDTTPPTVVATPETNIVSNGNFETGDFSGWTLGGNSGLSQYGQPQIYIIGNPNAESGNYAAGIGSIGSDGSLSQDLATQAGQVYTIDFWLSNEGGAPNDFTASWNGTPLLTLNNAPASGYTEYKYTVTATGSTSHLEFDGLQQPTQWNLDNISVEAAQSGVVASGPKIDSAGNGALQTGDIATLTVNLTEAVTVAGGVPTLTLNDGGTAIYSGGSGTNALTFSYTVGSGDVTSDLAITAVNLNNATVQDSAGNNADLSGVVANPAGTLQVGTGPRFVYVSTDSNGVQTYDVEWSTPGFQPYEVLVLNPTNASTSYAHNFLYALPVDANLGSNRFGFAMNQLEALNTANQYNATIIEPIYPLESWYANNPNDPTINYETFTSTMLTNWVDSTFATTGDEQNLLLGFSKSGYGALDLLLKNPDLFTAAAAYDFPADMPSYDTFGQSTSEEYGTQQNFVNNYQLSSTFLDTLAAPFTALDRIAISEGSSYAGQVADFATRLASAGIEYTLLDQSSDGHSWFGGWLSGMLTELYDLAAAICFMPGTLIRTPSGETAVETLKRGDLVLTMDGRAVPVTWIGRQTISRRFADPLRVLPVRIKAGALGDNVPSRDLSLSPDHAILIEGALVHAGALVNGTSIIRENDAPAVFTYYHVEVDDHSLILAENTPAETFVDNVDRMNFDNWAEHQALYPEGKAIEELPYPRAKAHRQVPRFTRAKLTERAAMIGLDPAVVAA